jgi:hypothetical protein
VLRLRNLEKLRALVEKSRESSLVLLARLTAALDDPPPEPLASALADAAEHDAIRIMTIHQAKGLEFPVVVLADAGSGLKGETDDVAFDAEMGLAVTARGRPIAACMQKAKTGLTAIQRVRRRLRDRNEGELARLLYVALTRARDNLYLVGAPRRAGAGSLLGLLDIVRAEHQAELDVLLPRIEVPAVPAAPPATAASSSLLEPLTLLPPPPVTRLRVRASDIGARVQAQMGLGFPAAASVDDDRLPPRVAGRLAHAIVALVATEAAEALADEESTRVAVTKAARACGVGDAPPQLLDRVVRTLRGPVRELLQTEHVLCFEEALWLEQDRVVVEGKADLVARSETRTVVVELKLSEARARGDAALLQVSAYAAALAQQGEKALFVSTWVLGDTDVEVQPFGRALQNRLARALASLVERLPLA